MDWKSTSILNSILIFIFSRLFSKRKTFNDINCRVLCGINKEPWLHVVHDIGGEKRPPDLNVKRQTRIFDSTTQKKKNKMTRESFSFWSDYIYTPMHSIHNTYHPSTSKKQKLDKNWPPLVFSFIPLIAFYTDYIKKNGEKRLRTVIIFVSQ